MKETTSDFVIELDSYSREIFFPDSRCVLLFCIHRFSNGMLCRIMSFVQEKALDGPIQFQFQPGITMKNSSLSVKL